MFTLFDRLIDPEDKDMKKWRSMVGYLLIVIFAVTTFLGVAATTGIPRFGTLAWSHEIDNRIKTITAPIEQKLSSVETAVAQQSIAGKALLAKITSDQIDQLVKRRCKSTVSDEIEYLSSEVRRLSISYEELQGRPYRELTCDQITYKEKVR